MKTVDFSETSAASDLKQMGLKTEILQSQKGGQCLLDYLMI